MALGFHSAVPVIRRSFSYRQVPKLSALHKDLGRSNKLGGERGEEGARLENSNPGRYTGYSQRRRHIEIDGWELAVRASLSKGDYDYRSRK